MPHLRTQIRDAVIARLKAGVPGVDGRVHGRTRLLRQFQPHDIPTILVRVDEVAPTIVTRVPPRAMRRMLMVSVDALVAIEDDAGDIDAALDDLGTDIEAALSKDSFSPAAADDWRMAGATVGPMAGVDDTYAALSVTYACSLTAVEGDPTTSVFA